MRWVRRHFNTLLIIACLILAGVGTYIRYEPGRDTAYEVKQIVTRSACKIDPKGEECQSILTSAIRNFDRRTTCILARKLLRVLGVEVQSRCEPERGPDGSTTNARPSGDAAPGPRSAGGSVTGEPAGPGSGGGSDGGADPQPQPPSPPDPSPPDPPSPTPPDSPSLPSPPASPPTLGDTVDGVTGAACQVTNALGVCIR